MVQGMKSMVQIIGINYMVQMTNLWLVQRMNSMVQMKNFMVTGINSTVK